MKIKKAKKQQREIFVIARVQVEGIHRWLQCPIEEVSFLRNYHRHIFHITAKVRVTDDNREVEFIELAHKIKQYLRYEYYDNTHRCLFFGDRSCEMIANDIVTQFNLYECEVNEDLEGGSIVRKI